MATPNSDGDEIAIRYRNDYSSAIGNGLSTDDIQEASAFITDATPDEVYHRYSEIPFVFEVLVKSDWGEKIAPLADRWVSV